MVGASLKRLAVGDHTNPQHPLQYSIFVQFLERNFKNYYSYIIRGYYALLVVGGTCHDDRRR